MFPSSRSIPIPEALEEERRLFYVGLTRCKDELYMTYPEMRLNAGYGEAFQRPSRFLSEIPEALLEPWEISAPTAGAKSALLIFSIPRSPVFLAAHYPKRASPSFRACEYNRGYRVPPEETPDAFRRRP